MIELYFVIKVICMIIGLIAMIACIAYNLWKWFR